MRSAARREEIIALVEEGLSNKQIAERLKITTQRVAATKHEARALGLLDPVAPALAANTISRTLAERGSRIGSLREVIDRLDGKVVRWLIEQTPDGAPVSDVVAALIVDAHAEEVGDA